MEWLRNRGERKWNETKRKGDRDHWFVFHFYFFHPMMLTQRRCHHHHSPSFSCLYMQSSISCSKLLSQKAWWMRRSSLALVEGRVSEGGARKKKAGIQQNRTSLRNPLKDKLEAIDSMKTLHDFCTDPPINDRARNQSFQLEKICYIQEDSRFCFTLQNTEKQEKGVATSTLLFFFYNS